MLPAANSMMFYFKGEERAKGKEYGKKGKGTTLFWSYYAGQKSAHTL